jgi:hypothetical protein
MQFFPVIFGGSSNHPLTLDYAARVAAVGGSLPVSAYRAYNYLFSSLVNTMGLNPADLYLHTFDGGINGIVVPAFNRSGAVGNATNVGFVSGDYSDANGLVQTGTKRLQTEFLSTDMTIVGTLYGAYHSGDTTAQRVLFSGSAGGLNNVLSFEWRSWSGSFARIIHNSNVDFPADGNPPATASGRIGAVSASANSLRVYRAGVVDGAVQTSTRSFSGVGAGIALGGSNNGGAFAAPAIATMVFALFVRGTGLNASQMAQLDAIVREFLIRRGRPPCD